MIIGEKNYGGAMVEHTIRTVDPDIPYEDANATRGKVIRAEPVSSLYEQNKIHHIGHFLELEDQLCSMTTSGYHGLRSPDRADALVWGFTALFPGMTQSERARNWTPPKVHTVKRSASRYDARR
jgi:phage terminase large subunit-like protein